ncbi:MAG TPA: hypothetical protein VE871_03580 [Longimicrobium sp.]|nr:hypothetical protein [Longimicrobium sp.]
MGKEIEAEFERCRPTGKPRRKGAIFVFPEEGDARHWVVKSPVRRLYEVQVEEVAILHIADWVWLELAQAAARNGQSAERIARSYWAGERTEEKPVIEWLVESATAVRELEVSAAEREEFSRSRFGTTPRDIASGFHLGGQ